MKRVTLKISGRVQSVGFRRLVYLYALEYGLCGTARNCPDGSVEVVVQGLDKRLKEFIAWCYTQDEPVRVQSIEESWSDPTSGFSCFMIVS